MKQLLIVAIGCNLFFSGCGKKILNKRSRIHYVSSEKTSENSHQDTSSSEPYLEPEPPSQNELDFSKLFAAYGIRSFEQVRETMAVLTGVSPQSAEVNAIYEEVKTQLPNSNDIKSFLASHQVGVSKLATEFCDEAFNSTAIRAQIAPGFNFTAAPNTAFSSVETSQFIEALMTSFWGSGLDSLPEKTQAEQVLSELINDLIQGSQNNEAATMNVAKGACTAVLASAPVLIF